VENFTILVSLGFSSIRSKCFIHFITRYISPQPFQQCRIACTSLNSLKFTIPRTRPGLQEELSSPARPPVTNSFKIWASARILPCILESMPLELPCPDRTSPLSTNLYSLHRRFAPVGINKTWTPRSRQIRISRTPFEGAFRIPRSPGRI
jgi:hypothetical protein